MSEAHTVNSTAAKRLTPPPPHSVTGWQQRTLILIVAIMSLLRFVALDETPAGFYVDEAAGAANILCMATEGVGEAGSRYPLFFPEFPGTGTFFTPTYVYSGALWTKLFGTSVATLRAHVAFYSVLAIGGVFALASRFIGTTGGLFAALAGALSPWAFQFSRIAWDPPLMPGFLIWGLVFLFRRGLGSAALSAILMGAAMYTYPTARLQVPLLLPLLFLFWWSETSSNGQTRRDRVMFLAVHLATLTLTITPLVLSTLNGTLQGRFNSISIFNHEWLQSSFGDDSFTTILRAFGHHIVLHLSPRFLLTHGDQNLRHGTGMFGVFSWVDGLAIVVAMTLLLTRRISLRPASSEGRLALLALSGFLSGIAVSSLTWEGIPHALRSIGSWPFLSLLTGVVLWRGAAISRALPYITIGIALAFSVAFANVYFRTYGPASAGSFDAVVKEAAEASLSSGDEKGLDGYGAFYPKQAMRYYLMHYRGLTCSESATYAAGLKK
ncbi:MAG TPA: hypothetical protein VNM92_17700 [Thermoanaerobaculia bacterium]|nr:hypothetical protein [Thermoanaerobaculia bacterium]